MKQDILINILNLLKDSQYGIVISRLNSELRVTPDTAYNAVETLVMLDLARVADSYEGLKVIEVKQQVEACQ